MNQHISGQQIRTLSECLFDLREVLEDYEFLNPHGVVMTSSQILEIAIERIEAYE